MPGRAFHRSSTIRAVPRRPSARPSTTRGLSPRLGSRRAPIVRHPCAMGTKAVAARRACPQRQLPAERSIQVVLYSADRRAGVYAVSPLRAVPDGPHDGDAAGKDGAPHDEGRSYLIADGPSNVTWLRSELGSSNLPGVFLRGGQLVYVASVTDAGYIAPRHPEDDNGPATVVPLTALALSTRIGDHYGVEK